MPKRLISKNKAKKKGKSNHSDIGLILYHKIMYIQFYSKTHSNIVITKSWCMKQTKEHVVIIKLPNSQLLGSIFLNKRFPNVNTERLKNHRKTICLHFLWNLFGNEWIGWLEILQKNCLVNCSNDVEAMN